MTFTKADCVISGEEVITHAQRIMGKGVVIIPPHESKVQSHWYYRVQEFKKY
jgi:hypothetical protein